MTADPNAIFLAGLFCGIGALAFLLFIFPPKA